MIVIIYGTTGELIKLFPLLESLPPDSYLTICTYQQPQQLKELRRITNIVEPDIKIGRSENASDLERFSSIPLWFVRVWYGFFKNRRSIKRAIKSASSQKGLLVVHGDTFTTIFGAIMGKLLGVQVAHVEAGLRSNNWRHPFPEELNRVYTSKIARLHFAPGDTPVKNLRSENTKGQIVNTRYNTVLDSLRLAQSSPHKLGITLPKAYCLVSIHRNELLAQPKELRKLLKQLRQFAEDMTILFLDHPITKERIHKLGMDDILEHQNIKRVTKQSYFNFIQLLTKANCVITDSGGLQEETAYLGIPCLVHRKATERTEGLGSNVVLSHYQNLVVSDFCKNYRDYKTEGVDRDISPTQIILDTLNKEQYISSD